MKKKISGLIIGILFISSFVLAQDTTVHENGITVNGIIESIGGGIKFPDGTVQITASSGGNSGGGSYVKVAIVAQGGGDYTDPLLAINNLASWCGIPSLSNPCLLKIMPGVYDIGTSTLQMQEYVDIEGSGENVTRIRGNLDGAPGVVAGADNAEIRFITVENIGGGTFAFGILSLNSSPKITNVTAIASGADEQLGISCEVNCSSVMTNVTAIVSGGIAALGFYIDDGASPTLMNAKAVATDSALNLGFDLNNNASPIMANVTAIALRGTKSHGFHFNGASSPTLTNVTAIASGGTTENYAIYNINSSSPLITNMTADASGVNSYGVYTKNFAAYTGGTIKIDHSVIKGLTNAIYTDTTFSALVGNSRIGGSVTGPGTNKCAGVYDDSYTFYSGTCP
jgi:hypothetical protein